MSDQQAGIYALGMFKTNFIIPFLALTGIVFTLGACEEKERASASRSALNYSSVQEENRILATSGTEIEFSAYLTGYSYWDNTPNKSATIAMPVIHRLAGGIGTFEDPVTIAVGHSIIDGKRIIDYPAGTLFYIPMLRKYTIVEDLCGDGSRPQDGPCHTGYKGYPWVDIYVDGENSSPVAAQKCMEKISGVQNIIMNPKPGRLVSQGALTETGCSTFVP